MNPNLREQPISKLTKKGRSDDLAWYKSSYPIINSYITYYTNLNYNKLPPIVKQKIAFEDLLIIRDRYASSFKRSVCDCFMR